MATKRINDDITLAYLLKKQENESGDGYCKMPDGTLIQWGNTALTATGTMTQIGSSGIYFALFYLSFPIPFIDTDYTVNGTTRYSTGHAVPLGAMPYSASQVALYAYDFYARSNNDGQRRFFWQAVGRWK